MRRLIWFQNSHEHRNHLLKYGLMKLDRAGRIHFTVQDNSALAYYYVSEKLRRHVHRHTTLILFQEGLSRKWILVDSEDSFFCLCPLIEEVDLYFCAGYSSQFFQEKSFITPYTWQTEEDIKEYKDKSYNLIQNFGDHFSKVRKLVPIGPNSHYSSCKKQDWFSRKWINLQDKARKRISNSINWQPQFEMFEKRYQQIYRLRDQSMQYDVVLSDTLWGWPRHRYQLHHQLAELSQKYRIHSSLKWNVAAEESEFSSKQFPMVTRPIDGNYEQMLASTKLAVFATGYHWGWRNIMTLALCIGIPVYMDEPVLEPYFDFNQFKVFRNLDSWQSLEYFLQQIDKDSWLKIKQHNQAVYDRYMTSEKVANYFLETVSS